MPREAEAWADLARTLAAALQAFADQTRDTEELTDPPAEQPPSPIDEHALGKRQRQIVELPGLAGEDDCGRALCFSVNAGLIELAWRLG